MIYHIMWMDEPVADVVTDEKNKIVDFKKIMPDGLKQPFSGEPFSIFRFYDFLKSRCYEDGRDGLNEILEAADMTWNNPYEWVMITHGVTWDDFFWIKFNDETIKWKDVRVR